MIPGIMDLANSGNSPQQLNCSKSIKEYRVAGIPKQSTFATNARILRNRLLRPRVNLVVTGLSQRKSFFIISSQWEKISKEIIEKTRRGVTILNGQGVYTRKEQNVLYTVITFRELSLVKKTVCDIDPDVIVNVSETPEVIGNQIGNEPHR